MNRAVLLLVLSSAVACSATARERGFRPVEAPTAASGGQSTLCTFTEPQISGYRAGAGERRICYYDCGGQPTAIVIRASALCSAGQTVLVWSSDAATASLERRPRGNGKLASNAPPPAQD